MQTNFPYLTLQNVPAVQEYWLKNAEMPTPGDGSVMQGPCYITAQAALSNSITLTAYLEGKSGISWEVLTRIMSRYKIVTGELRIPIF